MLAERALSPHACRRVHLSPEQVFRNCAGSDAARLSAQRSSGGGVMAAASRQKTDSPAQPSSSRRMSRSGKPVGWSVLPADDQDEGAAASPPSTDAGDLERSGDLEEVRVMTLLMAG